MKTFGTLVVCCFTLVVCGMKNTKQEARSPIPITNDPSRVIRPTRHEIPLVLILCLSIKNRDFPSHFYYIFLQNNQSLNCNVENSLMRYVVSNILHERLTLSPSPISFSDQYYYLLIVRYFTHLFSFNFIRLRVVRVYSNKTGASRPTTRYNKQYYLPTRCSIILK